MRTLLFAALLGTTLLITGGGRDATAKGNPLEITPDSGPSNTAVVLSSDSWQPGVQVQVYVGVSSTYAEPASFAGPITKKVADATGHWSFALNVSDMPGFTLPDTPAFIVYKAVSLLAPGSSSEPMESLAFFALTVPGQKVQRPDGAGGIILTIEGPYGTAFLDWEPAGSATFYISHVGPFGTPLRDYSLAHLANGDWDIVVPSTLVPVAATGGNVMTVQATLCASASIPCNPRPGPLTVVRIPVRDGATAHAAITMGVRTHVTAAPATGDGATATSHGSAPSVARALLAAGVFAILCGAGAGIRKRTA